MLHPDDFVTGQVVEVSSACLALDLLSHPSARFRLYLGPGDGELRVEHPGGHPEPERCMLHSDGPPRERLRRNRRVAAVPFHRLPVS